MSSGNHKAINRERAEFYLRRLSQSVDENGGLRIFHGIDLFKYELAKEIDCDRSLIIKEIVKSNGQISLDDLIKVCSSSVSHKPKNAKPYDTYFPLTVKFTGELPFDFFLNGVGFRIFDVFSASKKEIKIIGKIRGHQDYPGHVTWRDFGQLIRIRLPDHSVSLEAAQDRAIQTLDRFRQDYEFLLSSTNGLYITKAPSILATFHFPMWAYTTARDGKEDHLSWFVKEDNQIDFAKLESEGIDRIKNFERQISIKGKNKDQIKYVEFIRDLMALYANARESPTEEAALLGFWQFLERMALVTNGDTKQTVNRTCAVLYHFGLRFPFRGYIDDASRVRGSYVHKGQYDYTFDFRLLAEICRDCLRFFYYGRKFFDSIDEVQDMYHWIPGDDEALRRQQTINSKVRRIRQLTYRTKNSRLNSAT